MTDHLSDSYRLGAIRRWKRRRAMFQDGSTSLLELLDQYVGSLDQRIAERIGGGRIDRFLATGGNIESLAELASRSVPLRSEAGVDALPMKTLAASIQRLARMSFAERVEQLGLSRDRADVILPAAVVYYRLASVARVDRLLVPRVGLRDGLVRERLGKMARSRPTSTRCWPVPARANTTPVSQHAEQVREPRSPFDQTQPPLFRRRERVLLEAAALLHDIGTFIAASGHHKHSWYLIRASDVVGLAADERELVALVARYHRRSHPKRTHPGFEQLTREDRDVVLRLAAILRLADALDREHQAKMARIEVRLGKNGVELTLVPEDPKTGDLKSSVGPSVEGCPSPKRRAPVVVASKARIREQGAFGAVRSSSSATRLPSALHRRSRVAPAPHLETELKLLAPGLAGRVDRRCTRRVSLQPSGARRQHDRYLDTEGFDRERRAQPRLSVRDGEAELD